MNTICQSCQCILMTVYINLFGDKSRSLNLRSFIHGDFVKWPLNLTVKMSCIIRLISFLQ